MMTEEQQEQQMQEKLEEREQEERIRKGKRPRPFSGKDSPNAGQVQISRGGAVYQVQKNGSMKRLTPEAEKAVYQHLADNPVQMDCGALLHSFYCNKCGASRKEVCREIAVKLPMSVSHQTVKASAP